MCTRECICAWHVHRCVCMGAHTCVHVSGVERLPASLSPSFMPSSSHLTVLRGSRWRGGLDVPILGQVWKVPCPGALRTRAAACSGHTPRGGIHAHSGRTGSWVWDPCPLSTSLYLVSSPYSTLEANVC